MKEVVFIATESFTTVFGNVDAGGVSDLYERLSIFRRLKFVMSASGGLSELSNVRFCDC